MVAAQRLDCSVGLAALDHPVIHERVNRCPMMRCLIRIVLVPHRAHLLRMWVQDSESTDNLQKTTLVMLCNSISLVVAWIGSSGSSSKRSDHPGRTASKDLHPKRPTIFQWRLLPSHCDHSQAHEFASPIKLYLAFMPVLFIHPIFKINITN